MIALIGSGNVAAWVVDRLQGSKEFAVGQVYSRRLDRARRLAERVGAEAVNSLDAITRDAEIYLFSLSDDAYATVLDRFPFTMPVALHTAGSVSQQVFEGHAQSYGVLYPLQTFTEGVDYSQLRVPLCLETDKLGGAADRVSQLAAELSDMRRFLSEEQRTVAHLAAVFACNFSNAMYTAADELLHSGGLDMELLQPLLEQTLAKLRKMSPKEAQTGPARRGDLKVMRSQLEALADPKLREVYRVVSSYIEDQNR